MNVEVAGLMATNVVAVQRNHTVKHARGLMRRNGVHALPVVDPDGTVASIVSSRDLAADLKGGAPVSSVITTEVYTIPEYNDIHHAARLMRNRKIHHVVVTQEKKAVGMLSSFDLVDLVEQRRFEMKPGPTPSAKGAGRR